LENRTEEKDDLSGGKESSLWTVNRSWNGRWWCNGWFWFRFFDLRRWKKWRN
jgi:hypothetical protein